MLICLIRPVCQVHVCKNVRSFSVQCNENISERIYSHGVYRIYSHTLATKRKKRKFFVLFGKSIYKGILMI